MPKSITINYCECAFTLPWSDNRQEVHDEVYHTILEGKHVPSHQKTRAFVYDITRMGESALATVRAPAFSGEIPSEPGSFTVKENETLTIRARVSAARRQSHESAAGKRTIIHKAITAEDIPEWAEALLSRHGMTTKSIRCLNLQNHKVIKGKQSFMVNEVSIEAVVTVSAADQFANAFLAGVGRHKGYGLGKIEVISA